MFKVKIVPSNSLKICISYKQKLKSWMSSKVLLSQLTIKPPIFEEKFYQFSQLLFTMISASLPSTLSWVQGPSCTKGLDKPKIKRNQLLRFWFCHVRNKQVPAPNLISYLVIGSDFKSERFSELKFEFAI